MTPRGLLWVGARSEGRGKGRAGGGQEVEGEGVKDTSGSHKTRVHGNGEKSNQPRCCKECVF